MRKAAPSARRGLSIFWSPVRFAESTRASQLRTLRDDRVFIRHAAGSRLRCLFCGPLTYEVESGLETVALLNQIVRRALNLKSLSDAMTTNSCASFSLVSAASKLF